MKTFEDVAKFMEEHNWIQGISYALNKDAYCLSAAMEAVCGYNWPARKLGKVSEIDQDYDKYNYTKLWFGFTDKVGMTPISFNDRVAKSKEEVIAALRSL